MLQTGNAIRENGMQWFFYDPRLTGGAWKSGGHIFLLANFSPVYKFVSQNIKKPRNQSGFGGLHITWNRTQRLTIR